MLFGGSVMSEKFVKTIYHVVKLNGDYSFIPTTRNIIYTGDEQDSKKILFQRVKSSPENELYALVCDKRIIKVILEERGVLHEST